MQKDRVEGVEDGQSAGRCEWAVNKRFKKCKTCPFLGISRGTKQVVNNINIQDGVRRDFGKIRIWRPRG